MCPSSPLPGPCVLHTDLDPWHTWPASQPVSIPSSLLCPRPYLRYLQHRAPDTFMGPMKGYLIQGQAKRSRVKTWIYNQIIKIN